MMRVTWYIDVLLFLTVASCGDPQINTANVQTTPTSFSVPTPMLIYCEGASNTLGIGAGVKVVVVNDDASIYPLDAQSFKKLDKQIHLPQKTELTIYKGPFCEDNAYWWSVKCDDVTGINLCDEMQFGLIAEYLDGNQIILPKSLLDELKYFPMGPGKP